MSELDINIDPESVRAEQVELAELVINNKDLAPFDRAETYLRLAELNPDAEGTLVAVAIAEGYMKLAELDR